MPLVEGAPGERESRTLFLAFTRRAITQETAGALLRVLEACGRLTDMAINNSERTVRLHKKSSTSCKRQETLLVSGVMSQLHFQATPIALHVLLSCLRDGGLLLFVAVSSQVSVPVTKMLHSSLQSSSLQAFWLALLRKDCTGFSDFRTLLQIPSEISLSTLSRLSSPCWPLHGLLQAVRANMDLLRSQLELMQEMDWHLDGQQAVQAQPSLILDDVRDCQCLATNLLVFLLIQGRKALLSLPGCFDYKAKPAQKCVEGITYSDQWKTILLLNFQTFAAWDLQHSQGNTQSHDVGSKGEHHGLSVISKLRLLFCRTYMPVSKLCIKLELYLCSADEDMLWAICLRNLLFFAADL